MIPDDHSPQDDQTRSDLGETSAHGDQTGSNHDQTGSDHDQDAADRDQAASDQDQAASDHDRARGLGRDGYDSSRATRDNTTLARQGTSRERNQTAHLRDTVARERDLAATLRDRAAEARDHQADEVDASQRGDAARDRAEAARDRLSAAQDRAHAATEHEAARAGQPTRAARGGPGLAAVQREIERARRREGLLVVAYVDFDRLQATNDINDQDTENDRVKRLVGVMKAHLRPDELIVRLGGDEFLCALPGATIENVGRRVEELAGQLTASPEASPINVGLAELVVHDNAIDLVDRAHADLLAGCRE